MLAPILAALLVACSIPQRAAWKAGTGPTPPSVALIVMDDVGWDAWPFMPTLASLGSQGVTFSRAYGGTMCCPGRFALLYGQWGRRQGIGQNPLNPFDQSADMLPLSLTSLPELLSEHQSALIGKWHLGRSPGDPETVQSGPIDHGFGLWLAGTPSTVSLGPGASGYRDWWRVEYPSMAMETIYATSTQRDQFIGWWGATADPKLAVLSWSSAHDPFDRIPGVSQTVWTTLTDRQKFELIVGYMDAQLATVLAEIDLDTTYVIVVSDNGTPNSARPTGTPWNQWKFTTFEGGIRVPLVVAGPGIHQGVESERMVMLNDIGATLAELTGAPLVGFEDSLSFANELGQWPGTPPRWFCFAERYSDSIDDQAVIEPTWKLRRYDPDGSGPIQSTDTVYIRDTSNPLFVEEMPLVPPQSVYARLVSELESLPPRE